MGAPCGGDVGQNLGREGQVCRAYVGFKLGKGGRADDRDVGIGAGAAEGDGQIQQFLARQSGWVVDPLSLPLGRATDTGYALTPAHDGTDGFFVARLTRNS